MNRVIDRSRWQLTPKSRPGRVDATAEDSLDCDIAHTEERICNPLKS
jgi:hypothetical protein